ncbi:class I SAM-dependent methyltransferase [Parafilimonas terrae]|uniref:Methyltransferase domain-containing protein n=1 Tax=Parafilimonas terrae TaxID=1465490 RepID=A0A1I5U5U9_9BACT|nr:class I SAM-dependent methyltransferase [Parafilimonas terrae]SFP90695.1 Methyltransferase domain-containing protein [Parafilimonas terrae]
MQANEWFRIWFSSPYSDVLYRKHDKAEAAMLVNKLADKLQMPAGSYVLDAACGKGRHSVALAEKGFNTTGVDICAEAIAEAQKNKTENLHFYLHDIRLPFYINYFDYVFNFFTSFGYFKTTREHNDAIRTLAQSLKQNGLLVIDYLNVHYTEGHLKHNETLKLEGIDFNIERWSDEKYFFKRIHVHDTAKGIDETFTEQVEKFSLGDFTDMFSYQGLRVEDVFGDYNLNAYHVKNSPRMIMIAKKIH